MIRVFLLLLAAVFAMLFLLSFMPGMEAATGNAFFWVGQAGLAVNLIALLALGTKKKR